MARQVPFLTGQKYWISVFLHGSLYPVNTDEVLIQQIEMLSCGENCHRAANLIGAYRSAACEDQKIGLWRIPENLLRSRASASRDAGKTSSQSSRICCSVGLNSFPRNGTVHAGCHARRKKSFSFLPVLPRKLPYRTKKFTGKGVAHLSETGNRFNLQPIRSDGKPLRVPADSRYR